jgi:hypothetical protein
VTSPRDVGPVRLELYLGDRLVYGRLEHRPPYALFGNLGPDFRPWIGTPRAAQVYTVRAWPAAAGSETGTPPGTRNIDFTFSTSDAIRLRIHGFTLIDADLDVPLAGFESLAARHTLPVSSLPRLNIRADIGSALPGSVRFELHQDGQLIWEWIENNMPFALFGNTDSDYAPWSDGGPRPGSHYRITAVPYALDDARGTAGDALSIELEVAADAAPRGCTGAADCDDGLFCNGTESCHQGRCLSSGNPCPAGGYCTEYSATCRAGSWTPPAGIPAPEFGIEEIAAPYDAADNLHYYVDSSHGAATDDANRRGSPAQPRRTIPLDLPAGAVVEVRGGPYDYSSLAGKLYISGDGTPAQPIFIRGPGPDNRPVFAKDVFVKGSHIVLEHLTFHNHGVELRPVAGDLHHVAVRHCEFAGNGQARGGGTIKVIGNPTMVRDIVLFDNHVHDNGDNTPTAPELGRHGVLVSYNTERVWIVDNHIHDNGEDAVQVNFHGDVSPKLPARHVYIGRNVMHGDRENAVDLKICSDVVVSENVMYGYGPTPTSNGEALVIHADHPTPEHPAPERIWILNNHVSEAALGAVVTAGREVFLIGNLLTGIHHTESDYDPASIYAGGVAIHARNSGPVYIVNNTIHGCDTAVGVRADVELWGNILADIAEPQAHHLNIIDASTVAADHDLFHQSGGQVRIRWSGSTHSFGSFQAGSGLEAQGLEADPLLSGAPGDLRPQAGSPAVDAAGALHPAYAEFFERYGRSIAVDFAGAARVRSTFPDAGAYEF